MSLPFDGFKAAQTGLVDMGNISFYDTGATPAFNPFELAQYATSFSEIVLNVTWAQLQASQGSLDTSFIDNASQQVDLFKHLPHRPRHQAQGVGRLHRANWGVADSLFEHHHSPL
jgi:hypothetical protein